MQNARLFPYLSAQTIAALNDSAASDGIPVADLLEQAIAREVKRRAKRRALIARTRRLTQFDPLAVRLD